MLERGACSRSGTNAGPQTWKKVAAAESVTPRDKGCPDGDSFFTEGAGGFEPPGLGHTSHVTSIRSLGAAPA